MGCRLNWERGRRSEGQDRGGGDNAVGFGLSNVEGVSLPRFLPVLTFSTSLEGRNISLQPLHSQIFRAGRSGICFVNAACNKESHSGRQTAACLLIGRGLSHSLLGGPRHAVLER